MIFFREVQQLQFVAIVIALDAIVYYATAKPLAD